MAKIHYIPIAIIGILLVITITFGELSMSEYRRLLFENPGSDLILMTNLTDRVELLGRSTHRPDIEFFRWKYEDGKVKHYYGRDLVDTSYWQLFEGSTGIFWNDNTVSAEWGNGSAVVIFNFTYYSNPQHTKIVGELYRRIEIYPDLNKETIIWIPMNSSKKYNFRWIHETDNYIDSQIDLDEEYPEGIFFNGKGLRIDWSDSVSKVSQARHYKNGKVIIIYKSEEGMQVIDPEIGTFKKDRYLKLIDTYVDLTYAWSEYEICNPSMIKYLDSMKLEWFGQSNQLKNTKLQVLENITQNEAIPIYSVRQVCSQPPANETQKQVCTDEKYVSGYNNVQSVKEDWIDWDGQLNGNKCVRVRVYGKLNPQIGQRKIEHVPEVFGYKYDKYDWWNTTWNHKNCFNVSQGFPETLHNFTINVTLDTATIISATKMDSLGESLRFVWEANNLSLNWEWDDYNDEINTARTTAWVMIPNMTATEQTVCAYYNDTVQNGLTYENKSDGSMWNSTVYEVVYHYDWNDTYGVRDSTANGHNLICNIKPILNETGRWGMGLNGTKYGSGYECMSVDAFQPATNDNLTVSIWGNMTGEASDGVSPTQVFMAHTAIAVLIYDEVDNIPTSEGHTYFGVGTQSGWFGSGTTFSMHQNDWTIIHGRWHSGGIKNVSLDENGTLASNKIAGNGVIAANGDDIMSMNYAINGTIDEFRYSFYRRSDAWISAETNFSSENLGEESAPTSTSIATNITGDIEYGTMILFNAVGVDCLSDFYQTNCTTNPELSIGAYPAIYDFNGARSIDLNDTDYDGIVNESVTFTFNSNYIEVLDVVLNLTPAGPINPENIKIDVLNNSHYDVELEGELWDTGKVFLNRTNESTTTFNITDGFGVIYIKLYPKSEFVVMNITIGNVTPSSTITVDDEYEWDYDGTMSNPGRSVDEDFSTFGICFSSLCNVYENFSIPTTATADTLAWHGKVYSKDDATTDVNQTSFFYDWNLEEWVLTNNCYAGCGGPAILNWHEEGIDTSEYVNADGIFSTKMEMINSDGYQGGNKEDLWYYEGSINYTLTGPTNVEIDSLNDGTNESYTAIISGPTNIELNLTGIQDYLDGFNTSFEYVPLAILYSPSNINLSVYNVSINYTVFNLTMNYTSIKGAVTSTKQINSRIYSEGNVTVRDLIVPYTGNGNLTVFGYNSGAFSRDVNISREVYYSNFTVSMPSLYDPTFIPINNDSKNVTPYGQTSTIPLFNITALGYNKGINMTVFVNESYDTCINITLSTTNSRHIGNHWILNTTKTDIFTDLARSDEVYLYAWADFFGTCTDRWIEWFPIIMPCCTTCNPCW